MLLSSRILYSCILNLECLKILYIYTCDQYRFCFIHKIQLLVALCSFLHFLSFSYLPNTFRNFNLVLELELPILMVSLSSNTTTNSYVSSFTFTSLIELDQLNYTIWKSHISSLVLANGLEGLFDGSTLCPDQFLSSEIENLTTEL